MAVVDDVLLRVEDLRTEFVTDDGIVRAVDGVSFALGRGKTLGLVGESGCGKSVTALTLMRLLAPGARVTGGRILFEGRDLLALPESEMRTFRGNRIAMIFQEPMTSLNPVFTAGWQVMEAILQHQDATKAEARRRAIDLFRKVGIPAPEVRVDEYPHQMSGGMRQRVMIAMALACNPKLLIADEPTTALDVTIQAQILDLLRGLQREFGMSMLFITHDLGVIAEVADEVAVMYASKIVERADVRELYANPRHPYTLGLFKSKPKVGLAKGQPLNPIPGAVPNPLSFPPGCKFHPRCPYVEERCKGEEPGLREIAAGHKSACHFAERVGGG